MLGPLLLLLCIDNIQADLKKLLIGLANGN